MSFKTPPITVQIHLRGNSSIFNHCVLEPRNHNPRLLEPIPLHVLTPPQLSEDNLISELSTFQNTFMSSYSLSEVVHGFSCGLSVIIFGEEIVHLRPFPSKKVMQHEE